MVFSSQVFLFFFLPAALGLYYAAPRRARHLVLTVASYLFYGWANPAFMLLMLGSTVIDYACGLAMVGRLGRPFAGPLPELEAGTPRSRSQRLAVTISIVSNLSLLGFFKYFNFAMDNVHALAAALGAAGPELSPVLRITLPLGISFYTFQSMSYSIDVYRGHARAISRFIDFACYVSMFPQLVAGPIIRFSEVADQLRARDHTLEKFARGAAFFSLGLAKKVLLANPCGKVADVAFGAGSLGAGGAWYGVLAYAFQIYFDFSGYSDMAIGLGLMLGFTFPKNFDSPYHSRSITEFWQRWHISLSSWLRDYLYIPLGGNRKGKRRTYVNLAMVMLFGGLWHGASWNFVVWGGLHGAMLAWERAMGKDSLYRRLPAWIRVAITFVIVLFGWVFFRAETLSDALRYCAAMIGLGHPYPAAALVGGVTLRPYYLLVVGLAAVTTWAAPQTWDFTRRLTPVRLTAVLVAFWIALAVLFTQDFNPFIYFIF